MAQIVPKLNLNKTPQLVDNNSLIFAKNIRLAAGGLSADYGIDKVCDNFPAGYKIVGVIPYNTKFYIFIYRSGTSEVDADSKIYEYDELEETGSNLREIVTAWHYSGGVIDGICTVNLNGDILLTIAESGDNIHVPIKTINLTEAKATDDESIYTQTPKVPFINLIYLNKYKHTIPAGVYQFFVRYEIRKDFYTDWFPASNEIFAGCKKSMRTNHGGLNYIDKSVDSDFSFIFNVQHLINVEGYKSFQLGFILSHDEEVYARAYKHYDIYTNLLYFDYDTEAIEEIDVKDLLESPYTLYNVGNVTSFKNKLYVSNYTETDFNPDLNNFANNIEVEFDEKLNDSTARFAGREITLETDSGVDYITEIKLNDTDDQSNGDTLSISDIVELLLNNSEEDILRKHGYNVFNSIYGVRLSCFKTERKLNLDPEDDSHDTIPSALEKYELTVNNDSTIVAESIHIADIFDYIYNKIYAINTITGQACDDSYNSPLIFRIHYYYLQNQADYYEVHANISFIVTVSDIIKSYSLVNEYTLVPYQGYKFYVHLVRANGETTNGYEINHEPVIVPAPNEELSYHDFPAIYPKFTFNQNLPEGYVSCFISIAHVKNTVAQVFDITSETLGSNSYNLGHCLELDLNLYPWLKDIPFTEDNAEFDYRASYDTEFLHTFGGAGECVFNRALSQGITYGFALMRYEANEKYLQLTKCTPFIIPTEGYTYDEYKGLNLLGYLCRVKKPKRYTGLTKYFAGSDIYDKTTISDTGGSNGTIQLTPVGDTDTVWGTLWNSTEYTIYSNFNLNYLYLTNDIVPNIVTKTDNNNKKSYTLFTVQNSSQLSEVYTFSGTYKEYTKKLYSSYSTYNVITRFENTIRSSKLEGDEAKINMFKFAATDYYNVPTDKGIIVNLVAVGDNILVHTQDSIYKFSGQNSLTSSGGEDVQMKESEVFDTGIQELFGSEYGYAGLASKDHQILSEFGYTFWDKDSGRIYLYTGNAQMKVLSDDISKLLRRADITNIYLADDYYNNRIFICIHFSDNKIATLSYDFVAKSFISLHDFKFTWAFKTKSKCYFIHDLVNGIYNVIYRVGNTIGTYGDLAFNDTLYPKHSTSVPPTPVNDMISTPLVESEHNCIVDVIYNDRFEAIKTLNVIGWICNKVIGFNAPITNNPKTLLMAEEQFELDNPEKRYKGEYLRLYTDSCVTELIDISDRSNDSNLLNKDSYTQVRYNLGKWTFNYFRNILNNFVEENEDVPPFLQSYNHDSTLIYGKYIVARFIFNRTTNFKFEDVTFNVTNDYNV